MEYRFREEFDEARKYCTDVYGINYNISNIDDEDDWFTRPECNELLIANEWDEINSCDHVAPWSACPICGYNWYEDIFGNYGEDDEDYAD